MPTNPASAPIPASSPSTTSASPLPPVQFKWDGTRSPIAAFPVISAASPATTQHAPPAIQGTSCILRPKASDAEEKARCFLATSNTAGFNQFAWFSNTLTLIWALPNATPLSPTARPVLQAETTFAYCAIRDFSTTTTPASEAVPLELSPTTIRSASFCK